jgi:hypothetical protein
MENISPSLQLTLTVRTALENGYSVRTGVLQFLSISKDSFSELVGKWLLFIDQDQPYYHLIDTLHPCRRSLLILLEKGLKGLSILPHLMELEEEIVRSCEVELESQIQKLPILLMIPIFLFMFPAYLLLLFGPIIQSLLLQLNP